MHWLEIAAAIVAGWTVLSLALVVAWSRFMGHVARKERELAHVAISTGPVSLETYQAAA
jgi:hypothetical protein